MNSIAGVKSLMVKDFLKHESCHQNYVTIVHNAKDGSKVEDEYDLVSKTIDDTVIQNGVCITLDSLLKIKGVDEKNIGNQSRRNMKSFIQRNYSGNVAFLSTESKKSQLVMSMSSLENVSRGKKTLFNAVPVSDKTTLRHASNVLRKMIIDSVDDLPWPPTVESLEKRLESTPALLIQFFKMLLTT